MRIAQLRQLIIKKRSHNYFQGKPYLVEPGSPFGKAAKQALEKTFGQPVAFIREGGSSVEYIHTSRFLHQVLVHLFENNQLKSH
jgi:hypothetical protein